MIPGSGKTREIVLDGELAARAAAFAATARRSSGPERVWAHRNHLLLTRGCYSTDELIDMSLTQGWQIVDPFCCVRRGTRIANGAVIGEGTSILGANVSIGDRSVLLGATLTGDDVAIGSQNRISGELSLSNVTIGSCNTILGLTGEGPGGIHIGARNSITRVRVSNHSHAPIMVGDDNELHAGLALNIPFVPGRIRIGEHNSLGRDGGGVISSSYRFGRKWGGDVVIGRNVQTTRGAEILGFSVLGLPIPWLLETLSVNEAELARLFTDGALDELTSRVMNVVCAVDLHDVPPHSDIDVVSFYGTVKAKRCLLAGRATVKDDTKIQNAYLRDTLVPERCKIVHSSIAPLEGAILPISTQDIAIVGMTITKPVDWSKLPTITNADDYPPSDSVFYGDTTWDARETRSP